MSSVTSTKTAGGRSWTLVETENPAEATLCVFIDRTNIRTRDIPAVGDLYKDWTLAVPELYDEFGEWKYASFQSPSSPGDLTAFFWVRPRTEQERATPFRTYTTAHPYPWPTILVDLQFVFDEQFPIFGNRINTYSGDLESVAAARVYERKRVILPTNQNSKMVIEEYLSDEPYAASDMTHTQPIEGLVEWDFNGARGSIQCLHDDIELPSRGKPYQVATSGSPSGGNAPPEPNRIFPATNFVTWTKFVFSDEQKENNGQWYRRKCTLYPPPLPQVSEI